MQALDIYQVQPRIKPIAALWTYFAFKLLFLMFVIFFHILQLLENSKIK